MKKPAALPDYSILETELSRIAEQERVEQIKIVETGNGFYVVAEVQERPPESLYLATRREPDKPRMFSDLKRLNTLLRSMYPTGAIELTCESEYKPQQTSKKKAKAQK